MRQKRSGIKFCGPKSVRDRDMVISDSGFLFFVVDTWIKLLIFHV